MMVRPQRYNQLMRKNSLQNTSTNKQGDEESQTLIFDFGYIINPLYYYYKRPKFVFLFLLVLLSFCLLIFGPQLFNLYTFAVGNDGFFFDTAREYDPICSSVKSGTICCDRSSIRSDVCFMKGDIRTYSASSSIFLYSSNNINNGGGKVQEEDENDDDDEGEELQHEKIKPYTRKWEKNTMDTIDELDLVVVKKSKFRTKIDQNPCQVLHSVPAVIFSTGGYTGNVYHEFNDGILPLYITSQHLNKQVVFVILEYHDWWVTKYEDILSHLTDYPVIDFSNDNRTHCFPEAIVGLQIHDELTVDHSLMPGKNKTIRDFHDLLDQSYWPRIRGLIQSEQEEIQAKLGPEMSSSPQLNEEQEQKQEQEQEHEQKQKQEQEEMKRPKIVIISRNGSRSISNEDEMVGLAERIGFEVEVLKPQRTTELAKIYRALNSSDIMIGVHGAAMTHFLFMKPGSVFIQIIPLGTDWAAATYYGDPSMKLGLKYIPYKILPKESSLYDNHNKNDPILVDPESVNEKGWEFTKKIYLDGQSVNLDLQRFRKRLVRAYDYISKRNLQSSH